MDDVIAAVDAKQPGDEVELDRAPRRRAATVTVTLGDRADAVQARQRPGRRRRNFPSSPNRSGPILPRQPEHAAASLTRGAAAFHASGRIADRLPTRAMRIKICGITNLEDAEAAVGLGAWAIGLNHHPESPRFCRARRGGGDRRGAEAPLRGRRRVRQRAARRDRARRRATEQLTIVQLHGDEGPSFCPEVARRTGAKVIKAFRVRSGAEVRGARGLPRPTSTSSTPTGPALHGGTGESFDWELLAGRRSKVPADPRRRARPRQRRRGDRASANPWGVDVASGVEAEPGRKDPDLLAAFFDGRAAIPRPSDRRASSRCDRGHGRGSERFGPYGGRYVPETLIAALDELTAAWAEARADAGFRAELDALLRDFVGRPTPLYLAERLSERAGRPRLPEARGPRPHRRPQDQQRRRPGAAREADGQDAGHRRDRRRPARRRDRDRLRAARARVRRLHGHRGHAPPGAERRADAAAGRRGRARSRRARGR